MIDRVKKSALLGVLLAAVFALASSAQTVPSIVMSAATTINSNGVSNAGKVVQDSCGNFYELEEGGNLLEVPAGGGASIWIANHGGQWADGLPGGIAIDSSNNLYVDNKWNGQIIKIPSSNCVPNPGGSVTLTSNSSAWASNLGVYWYDPGDLATDAAGDLFIIPNNCCNSNGIYELVGGTAYGAGVLVLGGNSLPQVTTVGADPAGDVFFTVSGSGTVYEIPVGSYGTGKPTAVISSGLNTALGVSFDSFGNMFVGDSGTGSIYEVPFTTAGSSTTRALQFGSMYLVASGLPLGTPITVGKDGRSILYANGGGSIYQQVLGAANFGSVAIGSTGNATVNVAFNSAVQPSAISFSSNAAITGTGGTCAAGTSYTAGQACTITAQFAPAVPGSASSSVAMAGSNGSALAAAYLEGIGLGAGLTVDTGTLSPVGGGFAVPTSVAIDAAGDTFIADAGKNAILEFTPGSTTAISIGSNLSKPAGVAVDGAGNVIVADTGNNQIVEVPMVNGALSNAAQITIVSASDAKKNPTPIAGAVLSSPAGVTIDALGNLYIADTGNNRVVYLPYSGSWNMAQASVLGSNLSAPLATAVDAWGTVYIANSGSGQIYRLPVPLSSGVQQLVAVGYSNPSALATDASGSLFVVNQGAGSILRIPSLSGTLNPNEAIEVGFGIANPYGIAIDGSGNLHVSDSADAAAYLVTRTSTTEAFGDWALNAASGPLPVKLENEGNQKLTFASPFFTAGGNTGDFSLSSAPTTECANGATVAVGDGCELDAIFQPTASGARTETLTLNSNAANTASAQVILSGSGAAEVTTTTSLVITSPANGSPFFGQPITLTATIKSSNGTPTGSAQLLVDGVITGESTLTSTGAATFTLATGLTGGKHSLQAVYLGSSTFDGSTSSVLEISVSTAPTTSTLAITAPFIDPYSAVAGTSVTFTVTVNSTGVGIPTGSLSFITGTTSLGTVALAPAAGGAFQASITTTNLPVGKDLVIATYSGDANYVRSSTSGTVIVVAAPTLVVSTSGTNLTSSATSDSSITFTHTSEGGWQGVVGYKCLASTLPANAICVFSPGQVAVQASTTGSVYPPSTTKMKVVVDNPPNSPAQGSMLWWVGGLTGLFLFWTRRRMMRGAWGTITMVIGAALLAISASGLMACNSGIAFQTPAGTSTITVIASADPYLNPSTPTTQPCGINPTTKQEDPTLAPCSQQTYSISLTAQ
jgi:sugar lactone lactonase YvrE